MEWSLAPVNIPTIRAPTPTPGVSSAPRVRQALVHAASGISTRDAKQLLSVDYGPLVIHLLDGLHRAGLERAVVCLGENASAVEHAVQTHAPKIKVDYVYSPPSLWRNLANSIIAARTAFPGSEPLLVLRADQLYDWRVLAASPTRPSRAAAPRRAALTPSRSSTRRRRRSSGRAASTAWTSCREAAARRCARCCATRTAAPSAARTSCATTTRWWRATCTRRGRRSSRCSAASSKNRSTRRSPTRWATLRRRARWAASR